MKILRRFVQSGVSLGARYLRGTGMWEDLLLLEGAQAAFAVRSLERLHCLADAEFKVFSQTGEDGILEWLIHRLPDIPNVFIEFGVSDYAESNTRFLLYNRNWRGLVMDGSPEHVDRIRRHHSFWKFDLTAAAAFIDRDNINDLFRSNGFSGEIGILSIDLDGNDYWVWEAITAVNPWIVVAEYNAVFGDLKPVTIPYDANFVRDRAHSSNLYFGTSIKALEYLADRRGYALLGTNRAGFNAFFVRKDLLHRFTDAIEERAPLPTLTRQSRTPDGGFSLLSGTARLGAISDMPVADAVTGKVCPLSAFGQVYSERWLKLMGASN